MTRSKIAELGKTDGKFIASMYKRFDLHDLINLEGADSLYKFIKKEAYKKYADKIHGPSTKNQIKNFNYMEKNVYEVGFVAGFFDFAIGVITKYKRKK